MTTDPRAALTPRRVLWLALVAVLAASWSHVAGAFGTLEHGGAPAFLLSMAWLGGPLAAVALDLGIVGLAWGVGARKRDKPGETPWDLWGGIAVFAVLSALANFDHALSVLGAAGETTGAATWTALDWYARVKVVALSATLPLLAIYLTRVVETAVDARQDTAGEDTNEDADQGQETGHSGDQNTAPDRGADKDIVGDTGQDIAAGALVMEWGNGERVVVPPDVINNGWGSIPRTTPVPPPQDKPAPAPHREAGQAKLTPDRYRALYAEHVPAGTGHQEADRIVAARARVSTKTAQRARLASANGNGQAEPA